MLHVSREAIVCFCYLLPDTLLPTYPIPWFVGILSHNIYTRQYPVLAASPVQIHICRHLQPPSKQSTDDLLSSKPFTP
jgi:hypothetical protein